ncbi:MAG: alkaline phosphatase family protein [Geodermatophilaceae bacterium]|nr:alkaline phosphatase family protein [Geodermatophilaceae bacterium]
MQFGPDRSRPDVLSVPAYGQNSLAELLPAIIAGLGVPGFVDVLGLAPALAGVRHVVLLLIDGLGEHNLVANSQAAPVMTSLPSPIGALQAASPSTTPVSLATLTTGVPPGEHGIVGFTVAVPGTDRLLTHIEWGTDPSPKQWQPATTIFERAAQAGVHVHAAGPAKFIGSGLTEATYRGAKYLAAVGPGDLVARAVAASGVGRPSLLYAYHGDLDMTGHIRGCSSDAWRFELGQVDALVASILTAMGPNTALVVTADHGMLDVATDDKIDLDASQDAPGAGDAAALGAGIRVVAGEPRARFLYTRPGAAGDVLAAWSAVLGERAWVMSREQAIDEGLFGPIVHAAHVERIGNVVAWACGGIAITASRREPGAHSLVGYHGSLTTAELDVPVRIGRG